MTSRERIHAALNHSQPDRAPVDFGSTSVTGIHVSCVSGLRDYFGLDPHPVKAIDCGQMLGEVEEDLKRAIGIDTEGVFRRLNRFGFPDQGWKPWRMFDGLEVLVPAGFNVTLDSQGDVLLHPQGDRSAPPSARMPKGGCFFDAIIRQDLLDEDRLDPKDNLQEFGPIQEDDLEHLHGECRRAAATGRAVVASFGGTAFGDVGLVPGVGLRHPKGIRDITEWYVSLSTRKEHVRRIFEGQCEIAMANLARIAARVDDLVDVAMICGADFGTQTSSFCSVETFRELWMPFYRVVNDWIHKNTRWKTFKHSCGSVEKFIPSFIESGFDILNPVQCSAAGMEPGHLKRTYGDRLVLWGAGVDTQKTLPFGTPAQVREQVLRRCDVLAREGGFVFTTVHNIQKGTPVENIVAMLAALRDFN